MGASFLAELHKTVRRPAAWVIGSILVVLVVLLGYVLPYALYASQQGNIPPQLAEQFLSSVYPENLTGTVLGLLGGGGLGLALVLVLGALFSGSEYGWQTFKLTLTQKPGRLAFLSGKLLALGAMLAIFTLLTFAAGAIASYAITASQGGPMDWPGFGQIAEALGAGWLALTVFAGLGFLLATLFRGSSLAIGLGLVYVLVLETLFSGFASQSETVQSISKALPGSNANSLVSSFRGSQQVAQAGATTTGAASVDPTQATLVLAAYAVAFLALSAALFRQRDVT